MNNNDYRREEFEKRRNYKGTISMCKGYECPIFMNCLLEIKQLQQENEQLSKEIDVWNKKYNDMFDENKQLKDLIDTILNFSFFKEECPLNFEFEDKSKEDEAQSVFYEDEWCENNCNDNYKDCWLKYFKKLQELEHEVAVEYDKQLFYEN